MATIHINGVLVGQTREMPQPSLVREELTTYAPESLWRPGDIVTRDGTDEHMILAIDGDLIDVRCVKAPDDGWTAVGEDESNLTRRYNFVRPGHAAAEVTVVDHSSTLQTPQIKG